MFSKLLICVFATATLTLMTFSSNAQDDGNSDRIELSTQEKSLLNNYRGDQKLLDSLLRAFARFAEATGKPSAEILNKFTLPYSVAVTTIPRNEKLSEYGTDMNLPFLKTGFHKQILNLRKESECCYLIRTASSYIRYIKTAEGYWKIYNYGDKPIE